MPGFFCAQRIIKFKCPMQDSVLFRHTGCTFDGIKLSRSSVKGWRYPPLMLDFKMPFIVRYILDSVIGFQKKVLLIVRQTLDWGIGFQGKVLIHIHIFKHETSCYWQAQNKKPKNLNWMHLFTRCLLHLCIQSSSLESTVFSALPCK